MLEVDQIEGTVGERQRVDVGAALAPARARRPGATCRVRDRRPPPAPTQSAPANPPSAVRCHSRDRARVAAARRRQQQAARDEWADRTGAAPAADRRTATRDERESAPAALCRVAICPRLLQTLHRIWPGCRTRCPSTGRPALACARLTISSSLIGDAARRLLSHGSCWPRFNRQVSSASRRTASAPKSTSRSGSPAITWSGSERARSGGRRARACSARPFRLQAASTSRHGEPGAGRRPQRRRRFRSADRRRPAGGARCRAARRARGRAASRRAVTRRQSASSGRWPYRRHVRAPDRLSRGGPAARCAAETAALADVPVLAADSLGPRSRPGYAATSS